MNWITKLGIVLYLWALFSLIDYRLLFFADDLPPMWQIATMTFCMILGALLFIFGERAK